MAAKRLKVKKRKEMRSDSVILGSLIILKRLPLGAQPSFLTQSNEQLCSV
jgi:hypothetical protein